MKNLISVLIVLLFPITVLAAPSVSGVSGTISEGSSITISGSGFGSKSIASPMLWGDFESGSSGASITSSGPNVYAGGLSSYSSWQKSGDNSLTINTSSPLNRSTKHARVSFTSGSVWYTFVSIPYTFSTEGQKLYFSYNYRYNVTSTWPRQTKAFIWYDSSDGDKMYMSTAFENCESGGWRMHVTQDGETYLSSAGRSLNNEWVRLENYMIQSGVNTNNGSWASAIIRASSIDANTRSSCFRTDSKSWVQLALGGAYYSMCGTDPATLDVDNIYIDNTPQRVEIGNASTWTACTYREIQIPTAWTTTSLSVTVRRGNFGATDTAYLYVVDPDGTVNSTGYQITFGDTPADTTPNQFTFTDVTGADRSTQYTSNQITISGIDATADVSITGGTYSKNGGAYTSSAGTCVNGDTFTVRCTSSGSYSTAVNVTLTVGGVSDTYTVMTGSAPATQTFKASGGVSLSGGASF